MGIGVSRGHQGCRGCQGHWEVAVAHCLGTTCLRGAGCLGTSAHWPEGTCLRGNSTISLGVSTDCLGTNYLGTNCLV